MALAQFDCKVGEGINTDMKAVRKDYFLRIPSSIGGGIGQSRTYMYLLRTAHPGEVSVTIWPKQLKEICAPLCDPG